MMNRTRRLWRSVILGLPLLLLTLLYSAVERRSWLPREITNRSGAMIDCLTYSPDGATLAFSDLNRIIFVDKDSGAVLHKLEGFRGQLRSLSYSVDGKFLLTAEGAPGGAVKLWNAQTWKLHKQLMSFEGKEAASLAKYSPDGHTVVAAGTVGMEEPVAEIRAWDTRTQKLLWSTSDVNQKVKSWVYHLAFSPSSQEVIYVIGNLYRHRDVTTGRMLVTRQAPHGEHDCYSPGGNYATGRVGKTQFELRDTNGKRLRILAAKQNAMPQVFSHNETLIAGAGSFGTVHLWDVTTGRLVRTLNHKNSSISSLAFSPDDRTLATGSTDGRITLWRLK